MKTNEVNRIVDVLEVVQEGKVEKINLDICLHQISINISKKHPSDNYAEKHYQLDFEGVSAFFFCNEQGDKRFNTEEWSWAELSGAHFQEPDDDNKIHIEYIKSKEYIAVPNFYLELWSSLFGIEASAVVVDGVRYKARD